MSSSTQENTLRESKKHRSISKKRKSLDTKEGGNSKLSKRTKRDSYDPKLETLGFLDQIFDRSTSYESFEESALQYYPKSQPLLQTYFNNKQKERGSQVKQQKKKKIKAAKTEEGNQQSTLSPKVKKQKKNPANTEETKGGKEHAEELDSAKTRELTLSFEADPSVGHSP